MCSKQFDSPSDVWSEWLLHGRYADDPAYEQAARAVLESYADRVLDGARLAAGMTLADIGSGEGLIAWRAIERVGASLRVRLTDISGPMLRHAEALATKRGVRAQCSFLRCGAERLEGMADASVDVVTTRAVLAYVADKGAALREFWRVLKPGGRISLAEPIFRDQAYEAMALREMVERQSASAPDHLLPLVHRWKAAQFPDTAEKIALSPIANTSERDLLRLAQGCGFVRIHLELHVDAQPSPITSWDVFLGTSPHPWAAPLRSILAEQFSAEERQLFELALRPVVEGGQSLVTDRIVYLSAEKPRA
jgi:ubiquinone/menaquinone biosynthesis C-methylase UbiE